MASNKVMIVGCGPGAAEFVTPAAARAAEAAEILAAAKDYPENRILIMSGRGAPQEFIDAADLATEMKEIKHPFQKGERAKFTIEF